MRDFTTHRNANKFHLSLFSSFLSCLSSFPFPPRRQRTWKQGDKGTHWAAEGAEGKASYTESQILVFFSQFKGQFHIKDGQPFN